MFYQSLVEDRTMEMELICRETIKPSSPTPSNLTNYPLSLFDNAIAPNAVPLIYFYPNETTEEEPHDLCDQKISILKSSLSQILSIYYPFAGRLNNDQHCIECKDQGVPFLVTRIKTKLSQILHNPTENLLNPLFPDEFQWKEIDSGCLVAIQINCFACGGIAISVCMSHKVGDASTLFNFINDWSIFNRKNRAQEEEEEEEEEETESIITLPSFDVGSTLFPQGDFPVSPPFAFIGNNNNVISRRLVFEGSQLESLKSMVSSQNVQNPTRVEVVVAMIYKCAVRASKLDANDTDLRVAINLRKRMVPPLTDKSLGNLVSSFYASSMDKSEFQLHEIVSKTREGLSEFCGKYVQNFGDLSSISKFLTGSGKTTKSLSRKEQSLFFFSSWCRFSMYEADFGWGKPIWVTVSGCPMRNTIVLMDRRDGKGIEVILSMEEKDMAMFERDVELLRYASLDPKRW